MFVAGISTGKSSKLITCSLTLLAGCIRWITTWRLTANAIVFVGFIRQKSFNGS